MILTISNTTTPAGNLGFLLHKHPDKLQTIDLAVGKAHIFYPECSVERTTVALMLDVDPIDMVRGGGRNLSCLLYTSPSPRDKRQSRMPSSA